MSLPSRLPSSLVRLVRVTSVALLVVAIASAALAEHQPKPPDSVKYVLNRKFLVVVDKEGGGAFPAGARVNSVTFSAVSGAASPPVTFTKISSKVLEKKKTGNGKNARLAVVVDPVVTDTTVTAEAAFESLSGEITFLVDDDANPMTADVPSEPIEIEPMPDPCPPDRFRDGFLKHLLRELSTMSPEERAAWCKQLQEILSALSKPEP